MGKSVCIPTSKSTRRRCFPHPVDPVPVAADVRRTVRRLGDGQPTSVFEKHGQQDGLSQIFAPNGANRVKDLRLRGAAPLDGKSFDGVGNVVKPCA
jgi:hypothetical protein